MLERMWRNGYPLALLVGMQTCAALWKTVWRFLKKYHFTVDEINAQEVGIVKWYSIVYVKHNFFIHSSVDGHLGSFHNLAIVESAAINIGVQVPLCISTPVSLG